MSFEEVIIEKKECVFKDHQKLDAFIKNALEKFFFVEPWDDLYKNTGAFAKYIISNKSTIPDLIIYNKSFNKNDCFEEATDDSKYNSFPRYRFILRAKNRKLYNPCDTREKGQTTIANEIRYLQKSNQNITKDKIIVKEAEQETPKERPMNQGHHYHGNAQQKKYNNFADLDDEEDPIWMNDNINDYYYKMKIKLFHTSPADQRICRC